MAVTEPSAKAGAASSSAATADIVTSGAANGGNTEAGNTEARSAKVSVRALVALTLVALLVYGVDQLTKFLVASRLTENEHVKVLGEVFQLHFVKNPGAAFSLASGSTWIFSVAASAVTIFIIIFARRIRSTGWAILFGMLLGGTAGNLTDRLFREPGFGVGHVVDFLQFYGFPAIFNIADSFIVASMGLFIILTIRGVGLDGRRTGTPVQNTGGAGPSDDAVDTSVDHDPQGDR